MFNVSIYQYVVNDGYGDIILRSHKKLEISECYLIKNCVYRIEDGVEVIDATSSKITKIDEQIKIGDEPMKHKYINIIKEMEEIE